MYTRLFSALSVLVAGASAQAVLLGDFEQSADGWEPEAGNVLPTLQYSTTGATSGSFAALAEVSADTGYDLLVKNFDGAILTAMQPGGTVSFDVTVDADSFSGGSYFETIFAYVGETLSFDGQLTAVSMSGTTSVSFVVPEISGQGAYFGIFLGMNTDATKGTGNVYFDNVQFEAVPEPMTLGLLSAAGLMALRRRRA